MTQIDGGALSVVYDAFGKRVEENLGSGVTDWVFGPTRKPIWAFNSSGGMRSEIYAGGAHLATYANGGTYFEYADAVGSERTHTSTMPLNPTDVCTNLAFGDGLACAGSAPNPIHFTGQLLDPHGLSHFHFRALSTTQGRWIAPDPAGMAAADAMNPQSWNLYAYVMNSPVNFIDPLGLATCTGNDGKKVNCPDPENSTTVTADPEPDTNWIDDVISGRAFGGKWGLAPQALPANNGNFSWWGAFAKNLFSWKNFTAEFKQGGCVNVAVNATAGALNPFSPSLATAGEGTAGVLAASQYNAAVQYAASAPNYLGGTGLIYPMKSSVVRGMIADANATAASAPLFALDGALLQGVITEGISMANGECH